MATATTARSTLREGSLGTLAGTGKLLRFQARRTRVYLTGWFAGMIGGTLAIAAAFPDMYATPDERAQFATTVDTPAMRSMTGPAEYIDAYAQSGAAMFAHQMILWSTLVVAVMYILLITRLTRADEETSRLEVIRSQPVGRRADLAAAMLLASISAVALGLLIGLSTLVMEDADFTGAMLYGLLHTAVAVTFAAITAVTAQIAGYSSTSNALAFGALAFGVLMSMVGNAQENAAVWLSPFGWAQETLAFTPEQNWVPIVVAAVVSAVLIWLAFALVARRDFGQGLMAARPGPATARAGLRSIGSLSFRLSRGLLWAGIITMVLLGAAYGSIVGGADDMFETLSETQRQIFEQEGASITEGFVVTISLISAFTATIFGLLVIGRARKEETGGRGELLAAAPVPRSGWPGSYLPIALVTATVASVVGTVSLALTGVGSMGEWSYFDEMLIGGLVHLPAIWIMVALAFACLGWLPRAGWLRWLPWAYVFIAGYFGPILEFPDAMLSVSPYEHVPSYPVEDLDWLPLVVLTVIAAAITAIGYMGVRRRNLQFS
ncbi:ABC transporter permease [Glycomyces tenuis]|uniref:ABC transporter permease n=1 Tax=Glycomyces tenuis TaxID=58116 RepID=UPI00041FC1DE|nr:hypothetical protein [Glycomyces tenuis]